MNTQTDQIANPASVYNKIGLQPLWSPIGVINNAPMTPPTKINDPSKPNL